MVPINPVRKCPLDRTFRAWEAPIMTATVLDDRRRLVMPPELSARSPVTVQRLDDDTWIVRRQKPQKGFVVVLMSDVKDLPDHPAMEKAEARLAEYSFKKLPPFEKL